MFKKRILSGVQPSGNLHLGNYLGAIKNFVALQEEYECLYCIVDLHAITVWQEPQKLKEQTREVAAAFIASGLNPDKNIIFNQSQVHEHTQLAWIFNCVARMGWLNRMTQFKDKAGKDKENVSVGLFGYPTLMAADILIYKATHVPVGEDQKQHLELCRDIAQKFNHDYSDDVFPLIEPLIFKKSARVMSLRDASKKMSKSDVSDYSRVMLSDSEEEISLKIKKAKTDAEVFPDNKASAEKRKEVFNLMHIYASINEMEIDDVIKDFANTELSNFKKKLADSLISVLVPINKEMKKLISDGKYLDSILEKGAERASSLARPVIKEVYEKIGFLNR
ncbi:MAG: Tryptophan--tRNA ligase [Alphaproteobacteria bacterium MarineAlpha5_Bin12]|nr:tryptophan--tRNA ligase [Pelagibacteraceae bacterium]MBG77348.1 tryptophan--tRNA ligase [Pelagibacteraceae bacterium]PPR41160.1 MAG: Tryptophan--tRNA ligase [Alphaproteobacteria bacterium MarineAlpha5_Bin12]|tara:strand:- start:25725 stop:26729 length:1005 start_codon:yes stop_codon:yes gene_type:complete